MCIKYTTFLEIFISKIFVVSVVLNCIVVVHSAWITPRILELARFIPDFDLPEFSLPSFPNSLNKNRVVSGTVGQIENHGYPSESHTVETEDGYILQIHRIPTTKAPLKKSQPDKMPKFPVLLMHGYLQSSADWVINSPWNNSLAFLLSDSGFDVWLGNARGNSYSKGHTKFPRNSNNYWDFSFHEMGKYDLPAMVNHILEQTGKRKVHYVGFSHGAAVLLTGLSTRPEYNEKIASGILLGPSVIQEYYVNGFLHAFPISARILNGVINNFGALPLFPPMLAGLINAFLTRFCHPSFDRIGICWNFIHLVFGDDDNLITKDQMPIITSAAPSAAGLKGLAHTVQHAVSHRFAEYDYGTDRNLELYGTSSPPSYNLTKVTIPVAIFVALHDSLAMKEDSKILARSVPNLLSYNEISYKKFNHIDYTYGGSVAFGVYLKAMENMKLAENREK